MVWPASVSTEGSPLPPLGCLCWLSVLQWEQLWRLSTHPMGLVTPQDLHTEGLYTGQLLVLSEQHPAWFSLPRPVAPVLGWVMPSVLPTSLEYFFTCNVYDQRCCHEIRLTPGPRWRRSPTSYFSVTTGLCLFLFLPS